MDFVLIPIVPLLTKHLKLDNYTPCGTNNSAKFCIINKRNNIRRVIFIAKSNFVSSQVDALQLGEVMKSHTACALPLELESLWWAA